MDVFGKFGGGVIKFQMKFIGGFFRLVFFAFFLKYFSHYITLICLSMKSYLGTQSQEVEFHETQIQLFQEIEFLIIRLKLCFFMRLKLSKNIDQEVEFLIMRLKFKKRIIRNFDLMIHLLVPSTIMRLKFKINYINLVNCTCD
jgi:hypothetical protein